MKTIQVTVITEVEDGTPQETHLTHDSDMTLMSTLLKEKLIAGNFCAGRGECQRCRIQFLQAAPIPASADRKAFTPDELRAGYRLACMARPKNDCVIRPDLIKSPKIDIITDTMQMSKKVDCIGQRIYQKETCESKIQETPYLIAVDLGTTTIAMQLMEIGSGQVIDTYCALNPQRSYGADVLSRIQAAGMGHAKELQNSVWNVLQSGAAKFDRTLRGGTEQISCMCIAGNTTMEHLLMGLPTESLGRSPFTPVEIGLQKCTLPDGKKEVYILPGISTFVGGDIAAGLYHCNLLNTLHLGQRTDGVTLFIDLGTNGEMAITDGKRMIVTATAAGPAFEGGAGAAVQGSDMIAVTAALLKQGMIDETGLLAEPYFEEGITITPPGKTESIHLTQKDIRDLQMAKAAVRAGVEILCEKMEHPKIKRVYLAGGFGYYLDVKAAVVIGLLPENLQQCTLAAGNTSLAGAFDMGRDLYMGRIQEETLMEELHAVESINLARQENFETLYLNYLNFN